MKREELIIDKQHELIAAYRVSDWALIDILEPELAQLLSLSPSPQPSATAEEKKDDDWKLVGHSSQIADTGDYDGCYEITNGKISLLTGDDDEYALQPIVDALNDSGSKFWQDDWFEFENRMLKDEIKNLHIKLYGKYAAKPVAEREVPSDDEIDVEFPVDYEGTADEIIKKIAIDFNYWWNGIGSLTENAFDEWWKLYGKEYAAKPVAERATDVRTFLCNRCGATCRLFDGSTPLGCCVTPVDHRTSGICGGEFIEITTKDRQ